MKFDLPSTYFYLKNCIPLIEISGATFFDLATLCDSEKSFLLITIPFPTLKKLFIDIDFNSNSDRNLFFGVRLRLRKIPKYFSFSDILCILYVQHPDEESACTGSK